ncbi:MAG: CBS domain-containing protein [Chloroflexi bacterium]|nr:CBS domain-containing protein [Chloroflexota bacterium]
MKLKEIMTNDVEVIRVNDTLQTAARKMRDLNIGFLPVFDGDQLIGVISDRDIIVRAIAEGTDPNSMLGRELATSPAICCFDDEGVDEAARTMHDNQIRRLVILSRQDSRLVGIVSLSDLALNTNGKLTGKVLKSVFEPVG